MARRKDPKGWKLAIFLLKFMIGGIIISALFSSDSVIEAIINVFPFSYPWSKLAEKFFQYLAGGQLSLPSLPPITVLDIVEDTIKLLLAIPFLYLARGLLCPRKPRTKRYRNQTRISFYRRFVIGYIAIPFGVALLASGVTSMLMDPIRTMGNKVIEIVLSSLVIAAFFGLALWAIYTLSKWGALRSLLYLGLKLLCEIVNIFAAYILILILIIFAGNLKHWTIFLPIIVIVLGLMVLFGVLTGKVAGRAESKLPKSQNFNTKWLFS